MNGVSPKLKAIRFPLPRRTDEEWKNRMAQILWGGRLSSYSLGFYYKVMDNLLGVMLENGTYVVVDIVNEEWDFIVIDDLFWSFGFALTTLKHRLWELKGRNGKQPHIIVYATAAISLMSAESTRSVVIPHQMFNMKKLGINDFSWSDLHSRTSLQFADSIDRLGWPQAGTIYAAFGTNVDWSRAPKYVYEALLKAFNRFKDYRIIFVYNGPELPELGKHILLTKWAPQLEILAHHKTKVFISHGGNKSLREALCSGVPLIVMPVYAEQAHSAHLMLAMGHAPVINKFTLTEESVFNTIEGVIF
uniref:UDP-glucuronosyltransferase n=1 Tax=Meloidogyne hapla TaxID=6305 RepID=A0A1I8BT90_MELHA